MAIQFNLNNVNKSSFALLRTNPKLTSNAKLTVNSNDQIFLSAFAADKILSEAQYQAYELNEKGSYSEDIAKFFRGLATNTIYKVARSYSDFTPYEEYSFQYEQQYNYGASFNSSKVYDEQYKILAPVWLDRNIPQQFVVYRIKDVDYSEQYDENTLGQNSRILELLKDATIVKTFDLTRESVLGKYLHNHVFNDAIPSSAIQQNFELDGVTKFRGIDIVNGGFAEKSEYLTRDILQSDTPEITFNEVMSLGFERNGIVSANLINLEFLFDDPNASNYEVYRYFGLYVNESPEGEFLIDTVTQKDLISIQPESTVSYIETDSFIDEDILPTNEDLLLPTLNYVKSGSGQFFHIKNATYFDDLRLPLSIDVNSDILNNYKKDDIVVTLDERVSNKGFIRFEIVENPSNNDRFYVGDLTEIENASYDLYDFTFIADSSLAAGTFNGQRFSSEGNLVQVAKALSNAIISSSISEYYAVYVNGTKIAIEDFAAGDGRKRMSFGVYNLNLSQFINVTVGNQRDMLPLIGTIPPSVSTDFTEWDNYGSLGGSKEGAVKVVNNQEIGALKVGDYVKKRNANKFVQIIDIQPDLLDDTKYRVIFKEEVKVSNDKLMQTYVKYSPVFGKFDAYDFLDFDFDFYSTDNSNIAELALEDFNSIDATGYFINLTPILEEEKVEEGIELDVINSEYDRLSENELKEFAIRSRVVPSLMKFAMKDASNARNLPYILNVSEAFGTNNISPDIDLEGGRNVDNLNMEHFHLNSVTSEFYDNIKDLTSYTDFDGNGITIDQLKSTDVDYFAMFFNWNGGLNQTSSEWNDATARKLYTKFSNGTQILEPSTVFRGLKYLYKKRKEFTEVAPTEFIDSTEVNDYRFGVTMNYVVSNATSDPNFVTYEVVKNDAFKFICVVLTVNVTKNDYPELNRLKLYELNDITVGGNVVDTSIPFQIDLNHPDTDWNLPEISVFASDFAVADGTAAFTNHITKDEFDNLSWVYFGTPIGQYCFKVDRVINDNQIITTSLPVPFDPVLGPQPDLPPMSIADIALIPITTSFYYYRGGASGFKFLLEEIVSYNYAKRFNSFGDISYTTITKDGEELSDRFILGIESGSEVVKKSIIDTTSDPERPKSYQLNNAEIGKVLRYRKDGGYFTLLKRFNGDYNPLFRQVATFTDIYASNKLNYPTVGDTQITPNDRNNLIYNYNNGKGVAFSSFKNTSDDYGYIKNMFFHKVNDQNVKNLLKLSQTTDKLPLYPKISEIAIDKKDFNLFKSKYASDFFTKSLPGGSSELVYGTLSPVEVKAFLASTIMKVKDNYDITAYDPTKETSLDSLDYIRVNRLNTNSIHWIETETEVIADFYLPKSVKDELLEDGILAKFRKYVDAANSYRDKTTIEDDLTVYIYQNIVPRFIIDTIDIYAIEGKNLSTEFKSVTDATELTAEGYTLQTNYEVKTYQSDSLSFRLIYKKKLGYNYSLKVLVKIEA